MQRPVAAESGLIHHPRTIIDAMTSRARFLEPMMCRAVSELPQGPAWSYELKFDGYRGLGLRTEGRSRLFSRNSVSDFIERFPTVARALEKLPDETLIDGEIVAFDQNGRASFNEIQNHARNANILFYAFDVLVLADKDVRNLPFEERRDTAPSPTDAETRRFDSLFGNVRCSGGRPHRNGTRARS